MISYFIVGLAIPTVFNTNIWRSLDGAFSSIANIATIVIANAVFFLGTSKITGNRLLIFSNVTFANILLAVGCSLFFFILLDCLFDPFFDKLFPQSSFDYEVMLASLRRQPISSFIRVCLIAPVAEEFIIRGYVLNGLNNKYGFRMALLISTVLFAMLHFNFVQTISALICGLVIGLLYIKTDSLFCCVLTHITYNTISYFVYISAST